ncbi:MAG: PLP-dependent aminotransferase family protein [Chloroflexi bacterium]|nr:PLP-dependent aminotransferase family protein [Chloroflexota bacterium]
MPNQSNQKIAPPVPITDLDLDQNAGVPLYRQLYEGLRRSILVGELSPGVRLPSTRALAADLSIGRNTVVNAYEQLLAEGYLEGRTGSGTYVAAELPDHLLRVRSDQRKSAKSRKAGRGLSSRGHLLAGTTVSEPHDFAIPRAFRAGLPAMEIFPFKTWSRLWNRRWRSPSLDLLGYGDPAGYRPLREIIASYLGAVRGVRCEADQVIMIAGSQQALDIVTRVLLNEGDVVWVEDPGYPGARGAFQGAGAEVAPVPVDSQGLDIATGIARAPNARLAYVTPSHQYPLGITMTLSRRLELLDWAARNRSWVLEDDYDSEYRYAGLPIAALQGLDEEDSVIYVGSFSKTLFPSLRIGYMVVPQGLVDTFVAARELIDRGSPSLEQAVLADFMVEGHFERHIRRTRSLYAERQEALVESAERDLRGLMEVRPSSSGMDLIGRLAKGVDDRLAQRLAAQHDVEATPLSTYYFEPPEQGGLLLGFTGVDEAQIAAGTRRLAEALSSLD